MRGDICSSGNNRIETFEVVDTSPSLKRNMRICCMTSTSWLISMEALSVKDLILPRDVFSFSSLLPSFGGVRLLLWGPISNTIAVISNTTAVLSGV